MSTAVLTGPRWSSAVQCSRRAVYEGLGVEADPFSDETLAYFRRGRILGRLRAIEFDELLAADGRLPGQAEREIPWPAGDPVGVGHADYFIPDQAELIEVASTEGCELPAHKAVQLAGYVLNDPLATRGTVLSIDPSTFREKPYPIDPEGLREEVERIAAEVVAGIRDGVLPERPEGVESPTQRPCFDCPFRRECWKTWEPYPVGTLPPTVHGALARLADLEDELGPLDGDKHPHLKGERDEIRELLEGMMIEGGLYRAGLITVKWTAVAGRRTFALADYEKSGHKLPPIAQEFLSVGKGHRRWTVKRLEEGTP